MGFSTALALGAVVTGASIEEVARINDLFRVTEVSGKGSFCIPFLMPISYIELVRATRCGQG